MHFTEKLTISIESQFAELAGNLNKKQQKVISLGLGEPNFQTPKEIVIAAYQAMESGFTRYSNPMGILELRKKIVKKLQLENKIETNIDEIIITPGAKMALSLALSAILNPYDEVINFLPCYPSFQNQIIISQPLAKIININLRESDFSIDFKLLEKSITNKTKVVLFNFPHNPTGKMLNKTEFKKLVKILSKKNCWIISDEIYEYLNFSNLKHQSFGSVKNLAKKTITINGFSKAYSMTGWRIGYMHAPKKIMDKVVKIQQHINTNVPVFTQKAAIKAIEMPKNSIRKYNKILLNNFDYLNSSLKKTNKLNVNQSFGGLFSFVNISKTNLNSDRFCYLFLKEFNVATIPGKFFGSSWDNHIRLSLCCDPQNFKIGIKNLIKFLKKL